MLYFFILPAVALATVAMTVVSIICRLVTGLRWAYFLPYVLEQSGAGVEAIGRPGAFALIASLFVGPMVALVVGCGGGAIVGVWLGLHATRVRPRHR